jgi:glycosyltransferase involved in cell wall biosynthesis
VIAGREDGKAGNYLNTIRDWGLTSRVMVTGECSQDDLPKVYALARLFCFPSCAEGFGLPPLEAMASGVPTVVSNRTSMPEVCSTAATYVDPDNAMSIASAINSLLKDEELYKKKKMDGIERASLFNWKTTAIQLMNSLNLSVKNKKR